MIVEDLLRHDGEGSARVQTLLGDSRTRRRTRTDIAMTPRLHKPIVLLLTGVLAACGGAAPKPRAKAAVAPAIPPLLDAANVYAADAVGKLSPVVRGDPNLVYVPNSLSNTVDVISQKTYRIIRRFRVARRPQHVTPSYDLKTLYVSSDLGNSLAPIDPATGRPGGAPIPVAAPYNLYFTPDGRFAITVAELLHRLDFRDAHTMGLVHSLSVPGCPGVDHADFSADGRFMYLSCEYLGAMIEVDVAAQRVVRRLELKPKPASPQDVKLSPDGKVLYVADQDRGGVWEIDPVRFKVISFLPTGKGAHGLYPSRSARLLYVTNRIAGTISVIDFTTRQIVGTWNLGPSSPDMGGVSADGRTLWLSGRYNSEVYAINTRTGRLRARINVGAGPHGLSVWPQPGRYSLGHTGILR